jgi:hypothetical protein
MQLSLDATRGGETIWGKSPRKLLTAGCDDRIRWKRRRERPAVPAFGVHAGDQPLTPAYEATGANDGPIHTSNETGRAGVPKGAVAMIYGEPETPRFLVALQRLKRLQRKKERQTRLAKQRVRAVLRKMREC